MVNSLYNKAFGYTARKVIAHMPHFIDRDVLNECQVCYIQTPTDVDMPASTDTISQTAEEKIIVL
eukprot:m.194278 g.194278  ORF g.194278 m.194278 type:complete len:65 (-) comp25794_c0_seq1:121-315(-)